MDTTTPISPKVATGTTAGALVVIIIAILGGFDVDVFAEIASADTALVGWATPDHLRSLGARVQARDYDPKHDHDGGLEVIPATEATSDTKSDAAGL